MLYVTAILVTSFFGASSPVLAYQLAPEVEQNLDEVVEFNYRGSAIPSAPPCDGVCQQLRAAEVRPGTNSLVQLNSEARNLRTATGLLPRSFNFGRVLLKGNGATSIALLVGDVTGLNSKLVELAFPGAGDGGASYCNNDCAQFVQYLQSASPYPDWGGSPYPADEGGVYAWGYWLSGTGFFVRQVPDGQGPACDGDPAVAQGFTVLDALSRGDRCSATPIASQAGYILPSQVHAGQPIQDYAGQPYDFQFASSPDPGQSTVAQRTRAELESNRYPQLNQKLEFELGVPEVCDPVDPNVCNPEQTERDRQKRCELGERGIYQDPAPELGQRRGDPALYAVVTPFTRRTPGGGEAQTALRKGWTVPAPGDREWAGWGWRHVHAKHGWRPDDILHTTIALQTLPTTRDGGQTLEYHGPPYVQNGELCRRTVVVGPTRVFDGEPEPKEIITSYGGLALPDG